MTDGGAAYQPGAEEVAVPFRPRSAYVGYKAFGSGDGAVLVEPEVVRELRSAAEFATREERITGGLLYGRGWTDDQGAYLVVSGYLEAALGEDGAAPTPPDRADDFTLAEGDLRLLREDAARMYSASSEVGWWRTLPELGDYGPGDYVTQAELVGPDGLSLLVYGAGQHWGTAYLGPDGHAPDSAGTLVAAAGPEAGPVPDLTPEPEPDIASGPSLLAVEEEDEDPPPAPRPATSLVRRPLTPPPAPTGPRMHSPELVSTRDWRAQRTPPSHVEPDTPLDVKLVVLGMVIVVIIAAVMIGMIASSALVGVILAVIGVLLVLGFRWITHL